MKYLVTGLVIVSGIVLVFVRNQNDSKQIVVPESQNNQMILVVLPQTSSTSITVERVNLPAPGFIAVRSLDKGRLGQVIEISQYLSVGEHTNVAINLGDFYDGNPDLMVVAYQDAKDDKVFNDLDQPMLDVNKNVIAKYVKTGEAVAPELFTSTGEPAPHMMGGMKMETVRYTNTGYEPAQLEVPIGTMVQFINESDSFMWVASNEHPGHSILPTFDQFKSTSKGTTYTYVFDKAGSWLYHDHLKPAIVGTVTVI
jgi:plastocyanin